MEIGIKGEWGQKTNQNEGKYSCLKRCYPFKKKFVHRMCHNYTYMYRGALFKYNITQTSILLIRILIFKILSLMTFGIPESKRGNNFYSIGISFFSSLLLSIITASHNKFTH